MATCSLILPEDFDDFAWEVEAKGWYETTVRISTGDEHRVTFYDPVRLGQTIADEVRRRGIFHEQNLIVISTVTRREMEQALERLGTATLL